MYSNTNNLSLNERKQVKQPLCHLNAYVADVFLERCSDWRAWWLRNNQVSQYATWVLAYSLEQWLGEKGELRSPYSLQSKTDKTKRIRRQPVCVIPSGNPTLTSAWPSRPLWETEQHWCFFLETSLCLLGLSSLSPIRFWDNLMQL